MFAPRSVLRGPCAYARADQAHRKSLEDRRQLIAFRLVSAVAFIATLLLADAALGTSVSFRHNGTFTTPSFTESGLTVTSNTTGVGLLDSWGLGVIGGSSDFLIESGETVILTFPGPVEYARSVFQALEYTVEFEIFFGATSLGTMQAAPMNFQAPSWIFDLSGSFGWQHMTSVTMTGVGGSADGAQLERIDFTPVPEPATAISALIGFALLASAFCVAGGRAEPGKPLRLFRPRRATD